MGTMLISDLESTHPDYDPAISADKSLRALETYSDFYSGGRKFELNKGKYLRKRPIESVSAGRTYRDNRLGCAYYTPHMGGIGENLCGTALQFPPCFEATGTRSEYWTSLNMNIDGKGNDTRSLAWSLLQNLIIHKRAYIVINFPNLPDTDSDDATFRSLPAPEVDDWEKDENDEFVYVRTHCMDLIRSRGEFTPLDTEKHTWTFYTAEETVEYTAERPIGANSFPSKDGQPPVAQGGEPVPHGLKHCPVVLIEVEDNFWVADRLFSTAYAYFNREASRAFAIDTGALTLPVIKTEKDLNTLVTANGMAIKLNPSANEDFFWRSPEAGIYKALQDDCDYLLGNLYGALNQMALMASAKAGNPYQSGTSKGADAGAIKSFLSLLCCPLMAGLRKAKTWVNEYREDGNTVTVNGMNKFDVQAIELEIQRCLTWNSIPGLTDKMRKPSMWQAFMSYVGSNLPPDELKAAKDELDAAELPQTQSPNDTVVADATATGGGFSPGQVSQKFTKGKGTNAQPKSQPLTAKAS